MKSIAFEPIHQQSLSRQIADQIRQAIVDGSLEADDRLPTEEELAVRFNVSRPTIREALKRLAAQNLVRSKRGPSGGTFVNRPSVKELSESLAGATTLLVGLESFSLDEITQTRLSLETLCCRLAAEHRTDSDLDNLQKELTIQSNPDLTAEELCASDVRFHRAITDATSNRMISFIMYAVIEALQPVANMVAHRFREREIIYRQHQKIFEAISAKNAELAEHFMKEQILYLSDLYQAVADSRP